MPNSLSRLRHEAAIKQGHRCYYCGQPMWEDDPTDFISTYGISKRQIRFCRCTAEHLVARQNGGRNVTQNIVAACAFCNHGRHKKKIAPSPDAMRQDVQKRLSKGKWNGFIFSRPDLDTQPHRSAAA